MRPTPAGQAHPVGRVVDRGRDVGVRGERCGLPCPVDPQTGPYVRPAGQPADAVPSHPGERGPSGATGDPRRAGRQACRWASQAIKTATGSGEPDTARQGGAVRRRAELADRPDETRARRGAGPAAPVRPARAIRPTTASASMGRGCRSHAAPSAHRRSRLPSGGRSPTQPAGTVAAAADGPTSGATADTAPPPRRKITRTRSLGRTGSANLLNATRPPGRSSRAKLPRAAAGCGRKNKTKLASTASNECGRNVVGELCYAWTP